ncbi:MAG: DUF1140 family protein [Lactococcus raffinolactis]|jgi:hypothetical protein|nr:DUF1140 family protein [Lactococcus raffinolactis]
MKTEEIVQNYQIKLLKIIFKEIDNLIKFVSKYPEVMEKYRQTNIAGQ